MTDFLIDGQTNHSISPLDRGLAYGDGLFETIKVVAGSPCYWQYHLDRLFASAERFQFTVDRLELTRQLANDVKTLLARSNAEEECIKLLLTRGEGQRGYAIPAQQKPVRVVQHLPSNPKSGYYSQHGIDLYLCQLRLAQQPALAGIKHLNRLEQVLARNEWHDEFQEGVLRDTDDNVIEGVMSNLFFVEAGYLITPRLDQAGVAGIMRSRVLYWAQSQNIPTKVDRVTLPQLKAADHIFMCNSLNGIWPVNTFCQRPYSRASFYGDLVNWLHKDSLESVAQFTESL